MLPTHEGVFKPHDPFFACQFCFYRLRFSGCWKFGSFDVRLLMGDELTFFHNSIVKTLFLRNI